MGMFSLGFCLLGVVILALFVVGVFQARAQKVARALLWEQNRSNEEEAIRLLETYGTRGS